LPAGLANEIVLLDANKRRVEGEVMDLSHGLPFIPPVKIRAGDYSDCADAGLIVVTAGAKQLPGQSRLELVQRNADIVSSICGQIKEQDSDAVLVIVTNPVDVLTYLAIKKIGWQRGRVFGSGTVLDSWRFRYMLSRHCNVDSRNIHAYVLGEHGDSEMAAWSMTHVAGIPIKDYCAVCGACDTKITYEQITADVRNSAYHIIDYKGSTYYGIGLALVRISEAILRDENSVLTVSMLLEGEYGIRDVCLSVPCVVGGSGVSRIITASLDVKEQKDLESSANVLRQTFNSIKMKD
jgi:L-lactate dehydrogenase